MKKILIAERIRHYRQEHHLTQEAFGILLGVSAQAVWKWECGKSYPDITLLADLAELLECSVNDFFG